MPNLVQSPALTDEPSVRFKVRVGALGEDPRCADALDLLEQKQLPAGGWPAQGRYYKVSASIVLNGDYVDWGGTSSTRMNPWVTADALSVLRSAGRWT